MIWIIGFLMVVYMLALLRGIWVWAKKDRLNSGGHFQPKVTVLVPFRNEARNFPYVKLGLHRQKYTNLEVIFINDHSTDGSVAVLEKLLATVSIPSQILHLDQAEGKKAAIAKGVAAATGEIILTTDADCEFEGDWISEMVAPFANEEVQMVSGPVTLTGNGLFQRWQAMEFATLITMGAVGIRTGAPTMANGANLAYRKSAFEAVNGFEGIDQSPSGDDELLMMKINEAFPGSIRFRKSRGAMVQTAALKKWSDIKNQRLRWASKWKLGKRPATKITALFVFLLNLSWLLLPLFAYLDWVAPEWPIRIYSIRFVIEAIWVMAVATFFDSAISIRAFILHQYLYPFYVIYFGLMANFGNYQWKGRSYPVEVQ